MTSILILITWLITGIISIILCITELTKDDDVQVKDIPLLILVLLIGPFFIFFTIVDIIKKTIKVNPLDIVIFKKRK